MLHYDHGNINLAKALRKNMTPWEQKLWYRFLRAYHPRFQRQKAIGPYIVDFYCSKAKMIVELDGSGHLSKNIIEKDEKRTEYFEHSGIFVLRCYNTDIDKNFYGVCSVIDEKVKERMN